METPQKASGSEINFKKRLYFEYLYRNLKVIIRITIY